MRAALGAAAYSSTISRGRCPGKIVKEMLLAGKDPFTSSYR
jgi:hypothetical protein